MDRKTVTLIGDNADLIAPADCDAEIQRYCITTPRLLIGPCDKPSESELRQWLTEPQVAQSYFAARNTTVDDWLPQHPPLQGGSELNLIARDRHNRCLIGFFQLAEDHINYFVKPTHWGQGYGTEMVDNCCQYYSILMNIGTLKAMVIRENIASRRVLEKTGFSFINLLNSPNGNGLGVNTMLIYQRRTGV